MSWEKILLAAVFFAVMVGIYIALFLLNKKTPKPEGCENLKPDCSACHDFSCPNHSGHEE